MRPSEWTRSSHPGWKQETRGRVRTISHHDTALLNRPCSNSNLNPSMFFPFVFFLIHVWLNLTEHWQLSTAGESSSINHPPKELKGFSLLFESGLRQQQGRDTTTTFKLKATTTSQNQYTTTDTVATQYSATGHTHARRHMATAVRQLKELQQIESRGWGKQGESDKSVKQDVPTICIHKYVWF